MENMEDLKGFFHIERIDEPVTDTFEDGEALQELILDFPYTENLSFKSIANIEDKLGITCLAMVNA